MPVYIVGLSDEDFFEKAVAENKVRRVVGRSVKFRPDITEVSIRIKRSSPKGSRTRYELTARALSPNGHVYVTEKGWDLLQVFDETCEALGKALRKTKPEHPRQTRRKRTPR